MFRTYLLNNNKTYRYIFFHGKPNLIFLFVSLLFVYLLYNTIPFPQIIISKKEKREEKIKSTLKERTGSDLEERKKNKHLKEKHKRKKKNSERK